MNIFQCWTCPGDASPASPASPDNRLERLLTKGWFSHFSFVPYQRSDSMITRWCGYICGLEQHRTSAPTDRYIHFNDDCEVSRLNCFGLKPQITPFESIALYSGVSNRQLLKPTASQTDDKSDGAPSDRLKMDSRSTNWGQEAKPKLETRNARQSKKMECWRWRQAVVSHRLWARIQTMKGEISNEETSKDQTSKDQTPTDQTPKLRTQMESIWSDDKPRQAAKIGGILSGAFFINLSSANYSSTI